ncbi:MAG: DUF1684 domain-containing protein [Arenimonas sp.]
MNKLISFGLISILSIGLNACSNEPSPEEVQANAALQAAKLAYEKEIKLARTERLERLQKPDGWLSLVGMHWIEVGTTRVGHGDDNGTKIAAGPDLIGMLTLSKEGKITLQPEGGSGITINGEPASGTATLLSDADGEPTVVGFNQGGASFIVIKRGDRYALRVRDALAPTRMHFPGIEYFDISKDYRFQATFVPHEAGKKIEIMNILGMVEPMDNPGEVVFTKDGKEFRLETVDEGDGRLFIIFADRTSGHETYAAARFLYADNPGPKGGITVVDFNKAYNPPCAFTSFSTCPTPPLQNRMDMRVEAGEKKPLKLSQ